MKNYKKIILQRIVYVLWMVELKVGLFFPDIEKEVKNILKNIGITSSVGNHIYLLEVQYLYEQPKYYQNSEFFNIKPQDIINC